MNSRYRIGFAAAFLAVFLALAAGYRLTYERVIQNEAVSRESADAPSIAAEGEAVKGEAQEDPEEEEGFYLCEQQGFVAVYLGDRETLYELTGIPLSSLPAEVQQEIAAGKPVSGEEELYGFLENYSS
ncbi:MAG TPA: hypothetical protein H9799_05315 [Candidatus Mediterraneibacter merdipullorum]|nr:hypothetical protein [Candidatus Mediterraneibacter merdipullorum]